MDLSEPSPLHLSAAAGDPGSTDAVVPAPPAPAGERAAANDPQAPGWLLALLARALSHDDADAATLAVLSDLALALSAERLTLGWLQGGRVRVTGLVGADSAGGRQMAAAMAAAMDEALQAGASLVHEPGRPAADAAWPAHEALAGRNGGLALATVPVLAGTRLLGALLCERRDGIDAPTLRRLQDAALFVAPLLVLQQQQGAPLPQRLRQALRAPHRPAAGPGARRTARWAVALPCIGVLAALLAVWPMQLEVVAPARLDGGDQRTVAAPHDGFIARVAVRPGQAVKAGELLLALDDRDQQLQRERWRAEAAQLDKQYREALTGDDAAPIALARARLEQAQAQLALADAELARTALRAPFDGIVIAGELQQSTGTPVQRGQNLLTVAPALRLTVVAEVDEQDIARLAQGQAARVLFAAQGQGAQAFRIERVSPVAAQVDGRPVFEVEGRIDAAPGSDLRPGQRGIARIAIGDGRLGPALWDAAGAQLRRWSWRLLG